MGTREGSEALSASELKHRKDMEYEEDDGQEENVVELKHAMLSIPNLPIPRGSDGKVASSLLSIDDGLTAVPSDVGYQDAELRETRFEAIL